MIDRLIDAKKCKYCQKVLEDESKDFCPPFHIQILIGSDCETRYFVNELNLKEVEDVSVHN